MILKNTILRILVSATLFSFITGIVVVIIGLRLGWNSSTQFSDGFFWAGAILISIGLVNHLGKLSRGTIPGLQNGESEVHWDAVERFKIWDADTFRGNNLLAFLGTSCLLMFGLAGLVILVGRLF